MRLTDLLALSHVPRWSITAHSRSQTVSDHTFRVAVISIELAARVGVQLHVGDLIRILFHDGHEAWTADLPSPIKKELSSHYDFDRSIPWMRGIPKFTGPDQERVFELADKIEAYTFISKYGQGEQAKRIGTGILSHIHGLVPDKNWQAAIGNLILDVMEERGRGYSWHTESS